MNRIGAEFRQITDRQSSLGAVQLLYLRHLLIEGKAAAQAQRGSAAFGMEGEMARGFVEQVAIDLAVDARAAWSGTAVAMPPAPTISDASLKREPGATKDYALIPIISDIPEGDIDDPSLMATVARLNEAKMLQQRKETGKDHVPETVPKPCRPRKSGWRSAPSTGTLMFSARFLRGLKTTASCLTRR